MTISKCEISKEEIENGKRKRLVLTINAELKKCLKKQYAELEIYDYAFSYYIEDMLLWVASDEKRLNQFINDNYEEYPPSGVKSIEEAIRHAAKEANRHASKEA